MNRIPVEDRVQAVAHEQKRAEPQEPHFHDRELRREMEQDGKREENRQARK